MLSKVPSKEKDINLSLFICMDLYIIWVLGFPVILFIICKFVGYILPITTITEDTTSCCCIFVCLSIVLTLNSSFASNFSHYCEYALNDIVLFRRHLWKFPSLKII